MSSTNNPSALSAQAIGMSQSAATATVANMILLSILIDKSGSMNPPDKIRGVIDGQNGLLDAFNGSSDESRDALRISQWLFDHEVKVVNGFVPLDSPDLVRFDDSRYVPDGGTALYDNIMAAMSATRAYADQCRQQGVNAKTLVAVITDGQDQHSSASVNDAKQAIENERQHGGRLIYVGVGNDNHVHYAEQLGLLPEDIMTVDATGKEIRRTFEVISAAGLSMIASSIQD